MAKLTMTRMTVVAPQSQRKGLLEFVQRRGLMECVDREDDGFFRRTDTDSRVALFGRTASSAEAALNVLDTHCPEKKGLLAGFMGRREVTVSEYTKLLPQAKQTFGAVSDINALQQQQNDCRAEIVRLNSQLAELEPWLNLDVPPETAGTLRTAVFIGAVGYGTTAEQFSAQLLERMQSAVGDQAAQIGVEVECVSASRELTALVVFTNRSDSEPVAAALRALGFTKPSSLGKELPKEKFDRLTERRDALSIDEDTIEELYEGFAEQRRTIQFFIDYYHMRAEKYTILGGLWQSKNTFVLTGYVPEKYAGKLAEALEERYEAAVELEAVDPADPEIPVALENNGFSRPVQNIVEMYSMPGPNDIDPTSLMSFFFYFFFGMMFSDAGYGLIMIIACSILLLKAPLEQRMRNNMKMFLFCGISTTFWGLMYGSFFGDAISVVSRVYFGHEITLAPLWINPVNEPMTLLIVSIALGFLQIFVGLGADIYRLCKQGKVADALFDDASWFLVLGGMIAWLAGAVIGLSVVATVGMWVFLAGIAVLLLTGGRKSPTVIGKITGGFPKLYSITSYVSDALSYSRLMALGLATGVIAQVFNLLGSMGSGVIGFILFLIVFAVGQGINFGINALGAYVHTIRLQYVEFFSKFYEGGGRMFQPFSVKTKYVRIKED